MYGVFAPPLKECENATYRHRIDDPDNYNFCVVPHTGYDALLFAGIAIIAACVLRGKFSALYVLLAGALCQVLAFPLNLGRFGNSLALWLGIEPADIFLYVFLPPMLLDSAVRIEFFIFKKMLMHVVCFAFLIVMFSTAIYTPLLLYAFGLVGQGWTWQHAALFAAMIASTDAVAVSAILKSGGGPERMVVLMEGESLFNDATSIVLFEIFFGAVKDLSKGRAPEHGGLLEHIQTIVFQIVWLAAGGAAIGYAFGLVTRLLFKFLHRRTGHSAPEQLALTLGMAYLCFYLANGPGKVSGVIAVVVFGLHGSATAVWGMSAKVVESGSFDVFWDTLSFALNGIVFFYAGASSVNFFWRTSHELYRDMGSAAALWECFRLLPLLYLAMLAVRLFCILLFNPLFRLAGTAMTSMEVIFVTVGGLRGAVSLILAQMVVTEQNPGSENQKVTAELAQWTAGMVVLTLLINAPVMPSLLRWTGLTGVSPVKQRMRAKAQRVLLRYTSTAIRELQQDEDELLRGVDWAEVRRLTDLSGKLETFSGKPKQEAPSEPKQEIRKSGMRRTVEWVAEHAPWLLPGRKKRGSASTPLLADQDEELGLAEQRARAGSTALTNVCENPEAIVAGDDALGPPSSSSGPLPPHPRVQSGGRSSSGRLVAPEEGERELGIRGAGGYGSDEVPFGSLSRRSRTRQSEVPAREVPVEDEEHPSFNVRDLDEVVASTDSNPVDKLAFQEVPPPEQCDSPPIPAGGRQTSRAQEPEQAVAEVRAPPPTPFAAAGGASFSQGPLHVNTAGGGARDEGLPSLASAASSHAGEEGGLTRLHTLQDEGRSFGSSPNPILQPPLIPAGDTPTAPAMPHLHWVTMEVVSGRSPSQEAPRGATQVWLNTGVSSRPRTSSPRAPLRSTSSKRRLSSRKLSRGLSTSLVRIQQELASVEEDDDSEEPHDLETPACQEAVGEARVRLVSGLKRYFHAKRGEGLLSARGMQILDHACDIAIDEAERPLALWKSVRQDACGSLYIQLLSRFQFKLRRFLVTTRKSNVLVHILFRVPADVISSVVARMLSRVMLRAVEVAVELWLGLSWSPQAQLLNDAAQRNVLAEEVKEQKGKVWRFIMDREIEAPARFQAIQTYRAAVAILHQQVMFVEQLFGAGIVDEAEKEVLLRPIEKAERRLYRQGAHLTTPKIVDRLRAVPYLSSVPTRVFDAVVARGELLKFQADDVIALCGRDQPEKHEGHGTWLVLAGLVRSNYTTRDGQIHDIFMGSGSVFGLLQALTGDELPGRGAYMAVGNGLNQGPLLFHFPQPLVDRITDKAESGDPDFQQLRLDMLRMAALVVLERCKVEVVAAAVLHYQHTAVQRVRHRALRRLAATPGKDGASPPGAMEAWKRLVAKQNTKEMLKPMLKKALAATSAGSDDDEDDNTTCILDDGSLQGPRSSPGTRSPWDKVGEGQGGERPLITDEQILCSMDSTAIFRAIRQQATKAIVKIKTALRDAELVTLRPGQRFEQRSTVVLMSGTLRTKGWTTVLPPGYDTSAPVSRQGSSSGPVEGPAALPRPAPSGKPRVVGPAGAGSTKVQRYEVEVQYMGPTVLPWLWEDEYRSDGEVLRRHSAISFYCSTPNGAMLIVCPASGAERGDEDLENDLEAGQNDDTPSGPGGGSSTISGVGASDGLGESSEEATAASGTSTSIQQRPRRLPTTYLHGMAEEEHVPAVPTGEFKSNMQILSLSNSTS